MQKKWLAPALVGVVMVAGGFLAACGDTTTASSTTVANMGATNFQTLPVTQSTLAPSTTIPPLPGQITGEQSYTVVYGDFLAKISEMFMLSAVAIAEANGWPEGVSHPLYPGDIIKIPAGGIVPYPTTTTEPTAAPTTEPCIKGTHVVKAGESPGLVADKYGVSLQALGLVNLDTEGYRAFLVGITINIPCT